MDNGSGAVQEPSGGQQAHKKKKRNIAKKLPVPQNDNGRRVFIVFDVEITDPKREFGRIFELGAIVVVQDNPNLVERTIIGSFNQLINPDGRAFGKVTKVMMNKRGLTEDQLRSEPKFDVLGRDLSHGLGSWLEREMLAFWWLTMEQLIFSSWLLNF